MTGFWNNRQAKYYRATFVNNGQLCFVTNPNHYPVMDGDLLYVDLGRDDLPIVAHSNSVLCCEIQLMIDVEEVQEVMQKHTFNMYREH